MSNESEIKTEPKVETQVPAIKQSIEMENGVVTPKNIDEAYRYSVAIQKSGLAPKQFDTAEKIMVAMQLAQELGLMPLSALKSMYVVNGTPALFGDLPLALVRKSGHLEYIKEIQFDKDGKETDGESEVVKATCIIKRKGEPETSRSFSWAEALKAGLTGSNTYAKYRKRMLQMRARSHALKDVFSDVLLGVAIQEYDFEGVEREVTPAKEDKPKTSALNDILSKTDVPKPEMENVQ